jgi:TolA-binding protein
LAGAIAKLRQEGEPEQALRILDQYQAQFKSGTLAPEAATTRIEALLRLGRNREALSLLDARHFDARGAGREMLVARAELRADRGRHAAALADFETVLSGSGQTDALAERASYGRALCRAKTGDRQGARRDFESYLARFPDGRFANQARAAVGTIR